MAAERLDRALEVERRAAVFAWLDTCIRRHGETLDHGLLSQGAPFHGGIQPILHRQKGIYKPARSPVALTLRTSTSDPYRDRFDGGDTLVYRMERRGPGGEDNRAALRAFHEHLPLVYLHQVSKTPPRFAVVHPVWIVSVDIEERAFHVETRPPVVAAGEVLGPRALVAPDAYERALERRYATRLIRTRLHQSTFRERVLAAYADRCAMCQLRERALLDAAHIDPDSDAGGVPVVTNGIALCKIHHAAFDAHLLSIEPQRLQVHVAPRLLAEQDGPMLRHGLQQLHGAAVRLPSARAHHPDIERLARHWNVFEAAAG